MRKKIMLFFIITIIFSLIMLTVSFGTLSNYQNIENAKNNLSHYNSFISIAISNNYNLDKDIEILTKLKEENKNVRFTLINTDGQNIYDSDLKDEEINYREEIEKALKEGEYGIVRYSKPLNKDMVYCATKMKNGYIIRTGIQLDKINVFKLQKIEIYIITLILILLLVIIISQRLTKIIVTPLKELEIITSKIAKGELDKRVKVLTNDEIGSLSKTFNNMADQLENTMEKLIDKQNRLSAILRSMDSGVVVIDNSHKILMINPYAKKIFGIYDDVIGMEISGAIKDSNFNSVFDDLYEYKEIRTEIPKKRELRIKTTEIINQGEHIGDVAVIQDITDIRKLENIRSQFVTNVSHELKTPLTSIKGFAETLRFVKDEDKKNKFLDIIDEEVERLTRLINDILTLSNIEQNKDKNKDIFNPNETIEKVFSVMIIEAQRKNISLIKDLKSTHNLFGNVDKFKQMILNMLDNAIKYSEEGCYVKICTKNVKDEIEIIIKDNGIGIPKKDIPRIFERFYRVDKARSRKNGGTGLGLAIVKYIVKSFNGKIRVESILGKGTVFKIKIKYKEI